MKNKICLIMLFAMLFVCIFAVAVSAEESAIPDWTDVIRYETGENAIAYKDGFDTTARVLLDNGDGTYSTYPSNYIIKGTDTKFSVSNELDFGALRTASGKNYSYASVIRFEMPVGYTSVEDRAFRSDKNFTALQTVKICEGVTSLGSYIVYKSTSIREVELPSTINSLGTEIAREATKLEKINIPKNVTVIPAYSFNGCTNLKTVNFSELENLEEIKTYAFYKCTSLETVILPEGLTTIREFAFKYCGATEIYVPSTLQTVETDIFSDSANLKKVICKSQEVGTEMFANAPLLETLILENTVTIRSNAFNPYIGKTGTGVLSNVEIPDTVTFIGEFAFSKTSIEKIVIPASVETIENGVFQNCPKLKKAVVLNSTISTNMFNNCTQLAELVITKEFEGFTGSAFASTSTFITYYEGTDYERLAALTNAPEKFKKAVASSYEDYKNGTHKQSNFIIIYGANLCEVAYGEHNIPEPTYYFTSYTEESSVKGVCTRCGIEEIKETVDPLFTCLGYSADVDNATGISIGFRVDHDAISAYERITGNKISYGLFVGVYDKLGNNDVINAETGDVNDGTVVADLSSGGFILLKLKIAGFETDAQKTSKFAVGTYVSNGKTLEYVQNGKPTGENKYCYVSYSEIAG